MTLLQMAHVVNLSAGVLELTMSVAASCVFNFQLSPTRLKAISDNLLV